MPKHNFAFDQQDYTGIFLISRYYQTITRTETALHFSPDLLHRGFGANYSGDRFAAVHEDLVI